jgi:hypothetical protein
VTHWFPDNSVIINFALLQRLDLLKSYLRGQGKVTQAVSHEINASAGWVPAMVSLDQKEWFGKPIRVTDDHERVEGIRRHVFGGRPDEPRKHLGESETLYLIKFRADYADSVWITEDRSAYDFARANSIIARNTFEVLCELCAFGEISRADAYQCCQYLDQNERVFYSPKLPNELGG